MKFVLKTLLPATSALVIAITAVLGVMPAKPALATFTCPTTSTRNYTSITITQIDTEKSSVVRPTWNHPDKTLWMRNSPDGTTVGPWNNLANGTLDFWDYGINDTLSPQFASIFVPARLPVFTHTYEIHKWDYNGPSNNLVSPNPGVVLSTFERNGLPTSKGDDAYVTALGVAAVPGEALRSPSVGYSIGTDVPFGAVVLYADSDKHSITLHFTAEDSVANGYTVQIDNVCIDANLQTAYDDLDAGDGTSNTGRYRYKTGRQYELPALTAGQAFGTAMGNEIVLVMRSGGTRKDPRSQFDWWNARPSKGGPGLGSPGPSETFSTPNVTFQWSPVGKDGDPSAAYASYELQIDTSTGFKNPNSITVSGTSTSVFLASGTYYWRTRVSNSANWSATRKLFETAGSTLTSPDDGALLTTHTPTFEWTAMGGSATHMVEIATDALFKHIVQSSTASADTTFTPSTDLPDGTYYWHVVSYDGSSTVVGISLARSFTIDTTPPDVPYNSAPKNQSVTSLSQPKLSIRPVKDAKNYTYEWSTDPNFVTNVQTASSSHNFVTIAPAIDYGVYYWRVSSVDAALNASAWSYPYSFKVTRMTAPKPNTSTGDTTPKFAWSTFKGASTWELAYSTDSDPTDGSGPDVVVSGLPGSAKGYTVPAPLAYGVYTWSLRQTGGTWMPFQAFTVTHMTRPVTGYSTASGKVAFSWGTFTGSPGVVLAFGKDPDLSADTHVNLPGAAKSSSQSGLLDGLFYWAVSGDNGATYDPTWTFSITHMSLPKNGSFTVDTTPTFKWSAVPGATGYHLYIDTDSDPSDVTPINLASTVKSYTPPTPLNRLTQYFWYVVADTSGGPVTMPVWSVIEQ